MARDSGTWENAPSGDTQGASTPWSPPGLLTWDGSEASPQGPDGSGHRPPRQESPTHPEGCVPPGGRSATLFSSCLLGRALCPRDPAPHPAPSSQIQHRVRGWVVGGAAG